jgi:hypothetical protein
LWCFTQFKTKCGTYFCSTVEKVAEVKKGKAIPVTGRESQ